MGINSDVSNGCWAKGNLPGVEMWLQFLYTGKHSLWAGTQLHHLTFVMETAFVAALQPAINCPGNSSPLES